MSKNNLLIGISAFVLVFTLGYCCGAVDTENRMKEKAEQLARDRVAAMEQHRIWTERMDAYYNDKP